MSIKSEYTATGATVNRNSTNGRYAPKVLVEPKDAANGFGRPAPQFVVRDEDENPIGFDEGFCAAHGRRITMNMEAIAKKRPRVHPSGAIAELLEDLRCSYPVFSEDAGPDDYEAAVANLRVHLNENNVPAVEAEEHIERITFGVHMEMEHYKDPTYYERVADDWADMTPPGAEFDSPEEAYEFNLAEWSRVTEKSAVYASESYR